jgi:hypothetical protein
MRTVLRGLPFFLPALFHRLYQPINASWTVNIFGCGCPVDGVRTFNANHFNLILWCAVWLVSGIGWCWLMRRNVTSARGMAMCGAGIGLLAGMCNDYRCLELWL